MQVLAALSELEFSWNALAIAMGVFSFIFVPFLVSLVDFVPAFLGKNRKAITPQPGDVEVDDFGILIPIYGNIKYLTNAEALSEYGNRVYLCTTDQESPEFYRDLDTIAAKYRFKVVQAAIETAASDGSKKSTTSPIRDQIVRAAVEEVTNKYVVAIDADTVPDLPFGLLFGAMEQNGFEMTSTRLYPSNPGTLIARFQVIEYWLSMNLRRIMPWLVSGGCHAATTACYQAVMRRHSMFFQGNDVEVGLLAEDLGFKIGHVEFNVGTEVPDTFKPWWRQRFAWSGGEWRLAIGNLKLFPRHPLFFFYTTVIMIGMFPFRWYAVIFEPWLIPIVYGIYVVMISILRRRDWSWVILLYPFYATLNSLVLIPLGGYSYIQMSIKYRNWGWIHTHWRKVKATVTEPGAES